MVEYRLHCLAQSGNSYKVALMLELCDSDWEPVFVDYYNGAHRSPEFGAINEMGEVPVLDHGSTRLTQSGVILEYLAEGLERFGPRDADERREVLRWILWDTHKLSSYTATWRFLTSFATEDQRNPDAAQLLGDRARVAMGVLDRHMTSRDWIVGDRMTIADLSCAGYMFYTDEVPVDWDREFPNLVAWRERIRALPRWRHPYDLMPGHPIPGH
jgi:glutathione S-transferase